MQSLQGLKLILFPCADTHQRNVLSEQTLVQTCTVMPWKQLSAIVRRVRNSCLTPAMICQTSRKRKLDQEAAARFKCQKQPRQGAICHVGGPAWCLDWAPPSSPDADGNFTQLLAVGTCSLSHPRARDAGMCVGIGKSAHHSSHCSTGVSSATRRFASCVHPRLPASVGCTWARG